MTTATLEPETSSPTKDAACSAVKSLGQIAYEAGGRGIGWEQGSDETRKIWENIGAAVKAEVLRGTDTDRLIARAENAEFMEQTMKQTLTIERRHFAKIYGELAKLAESYQRWE